MSHIQSIGLIAGEGQFPFLIAKAARHQKIPVVAFAIKGVTPPALEQYAEKTFWLDLGQFDTLVRLFHEHALSHAVMAGRVPHTALLQGIKFDERSQRILMELQDKKANSVLGIITAELEREQIHVLDSSLFLKPYMPAAGLLTPERPLTSEEEKDVQFGFPIAREIARLDIGQTIVVKNQIVLAVEGAEGTNRAIQRGGELGGPGTVVIKVSKPQQDFRFDIPTVGLRTIEHMEQAGSSALAISAGETLFFDREEALALARRASIAIVAVEAPSTNSNP
jgi:DUF1009 family protein